MGMITFLMAGVGVAAFVLYFSHIKPELKLLGERIAMLEGK